MSKHLELMGLLHWLAAIITALVATAVLILGLGALSIVWSGGARVAASVTGGTFLVVAVLLMLWAGINAWVGREVRTHRRPLARHVAFAVAIVHLFVLPFGTALGAYGLWVLLHPEARALFEGH